MCLASAYWSGESDQPILQDIALMLVNGDDVNLQTLFGEQESVQGRVMEVDFEQSRIIMERRPATTSTSG